MSNPITMVRDPIVRPDEPRHFMVIKPLGHPVVAQRGEVQLARSVGAVRVQEVGSDLYDPVVYFPRQDVDMTRLRQSSKTTYCPLKGDTEYFDVVMDGHVIEAAAWSYHRVRDFDSRLERLRGRIAFDRAKVLVIEWTVVDESPDAAG